MALIAAMRRTRGRVPAAVCGGALGALLLATGAGLSAMDAVPGAQAQERSLVGRAAPAIAAKDFDGQVVRLREYRGKVVLLNFWASWCGPCKVEMPTFARWQKQYGGRLQVLGVSMDDDAGAAKAAAGKLGIDYPVVMGTAAMGNSYGGVYGLPVSFVIDAEGRIRAEYDGGNHVKEIQAEITRLLARR